MINFWDIIQFTASKVNDNKLLLRRFDLTVGVYLRLFFHFRPAHLVIYGPHLCKYGCYENWPTGRLVDKEKMRNLADSFIIIGHKSLIGP